MPAYWIARAKIHDPVEYKKYTDLVPGIIQKYGGKVLARGGKYQINEGPEDFHQRIKFEHGGVVWAAVQFFRICDGGLKTLRQISHGSGLQIDKQTLSPRAHSQVKLKKLSIFMACPAGPVRL